MAKAKWEVEPAPTGLYRTFQRRGWPTALTECNMFFSVDCADDYVPSKVKAGDHAPLKLGVRNDSLPGSPRRVFKRDFATLDEVKAFVASLDSTMLRARF